MLHRRAHVAFCESVAAAGAQVLEAGAVDVSEWPEVFTNHSAIYISAEAFSKAIVNASALNALRQNVTSKLRAASR